jgi:predicted site-specific integrase-resolvase
MAIELEELPLMLTRKDAARIFGINERFLDRLRIDGKVRVYKTEGGHARYYTSELIKHFKING